MIAERADVLVVKRRAMSDATRRCGCCRPGHLQHVAHEGLRVRAPRRVQHERHARGEAAVGEGLPQCRSTRFQPAARARLQVRMLWRQHWLVDGMGGEQER